ncbi:hypothetical protein SDC9_198162 [bioreactor metagenome]|uniref:Uncharacterized protein n=1 Tax=bioreactor metagenome TaxID=1076179 RepID=A0A645IGX8_9ZZZZ
MHVRGDAGLPECLAQRGRTALEVEHRLLPALRITDEDLDRVDPDGARLVQRRGRVDVGADQHGEFSHGATLAPPPGAGSNSCSARSFPRRFGRLARGATPTRHVSPARPMSGARRWDDAVTAPGVVGGPWAMRGRRREGQRWPRPAGRSCWPSPWS